MSLKTDTINKLPKFSAIKAQAEKEGFIVGITDWVEYGQIDITVRKDNMVSNYKENYCDCELDFYNNSLDDYFSRILYDAILNFYKYPYREILEDK